MAVVTHHPARASSRPAGLFRSQYVRRLLTVAGILGAIVLGFGSIRAAAAWTAASAPLTVAPVSVSTLQSRLMDERNRSAALLQQLQALESQSADLTSALQAANLRIEADTGHAQDLAAQLKTATQRLAKLSATIESASRAARGTPSAATGGRASTSVRPRLDDD